MTEKNKKPTTERELLERRFQRATGAERERLRRELERLGSRDSAEKR